MIVTFGDSVSSTAGKNMVATFYRSRHWCQLLAGKGGSPTFAVACDNAILFSGGIGGRQAEAGDVPIGHHIMN